MSRILVLTALSLGALLAPKTSVADSPSELLEKGIFSEETKGDLDEAIKIYKQILADAKANRGFVAQAQYRLGQCLLKKGSKKEAVAAFEKLITDYPDQKELVAKARKHLPKSSLGAIELAPVPWGSGETLQLQLVTATSAEIGTITYMADQATFNNKIGWLIRSQTFAMNTRSASRVEAAGDSFLPINSWWNQAVLGLATAKYSPDKVLVKIVGRDEKTIDVENVVYDNEQGVHLFRRLPLAVGYKTKVNVFTSFGYADVPLELEVTKQEKVKVPAGEFDCFALELNINQTFWISADKNRYLVKFEAGGVSAELISVRARKSDGKNTFHEKRIGATVSAPADWTFWRPSTKQNGKVVLLDPSAEFDSQFEINTREQFKLDEKTSVSKWAEDEVQNVFEKNLKDFKVRADSWKTLSIAGNPAVSFVADFTDGKKEKSIYGVLTLGKRLGAKFGFATDRDKLEASQKTFDEIVSTYQVKQP